MPTSRCICLLACIGLFPTVIPISAAQYQILPNILQPIFQKKEESTPPSKGPQEKNDPSYCLKDLYHANLCKTISESSANKFVALTAFLQKKSKKYHLQINLKYPPLSCCKQELSSKDIIDDIVCLKFFNVNTNITEQKVSFFKPDPPQPQTRVSFFDDKKYYPVWKTKEEPQLTSIQKIINTTITDWYICGDRHGDGISIDIMLNHLKEKEDIDLNGVLKPHIGIIFLGDYIDRGKDSVGVVHRVVQLKKKNRSNVFALRGNHEEGECGNGLQENLSIFGEKLLKKLHHWYIASFCNLPQIFFLQMPTQNKNSSVTPYINLMHGGIDSKQLNPETYHKNIGTLKKFLSDKKLTEEQLCYPEGPRRSPLWNDFSVNEKKISSNLGDMRGISVGRNDTRSFLLALQDPKSHVITFILRAHQQTPKEKFSDTTRIPGIGSYFLKNPTLNPKKLQSYYVNTLNVAPGNALATATRYKGQYQLKYDTWLHLQLNWSAGTWNEKFLHFDATTGKLTPTDQLIF
ncbi:TPA: hypothetical protein DCW54_03250 [Candidatus Dependentiae bacterium]|nr:hypothetical protein [Candidatus Dependentiae bacterium]